MQMKMAKATKEDIEKLVRFFYFIDEFMEYGTHTPCNDDEEEDSIDLDDEAFVEHLRKLWGQKYGPGEVGCSWRRVVHGCDILIDNCCDPAADTLELRTDWEKLIAAASVETTDAQSEVPHGK